MTTWAEVRQQFEDMKVTARTLRLERTWGSGTREERWFTICEDSLARERFEAVAMIAAQLLEASSGLDLGDEFSPAPDQVTHWYQVVWKLVGPSETPMYGTISRDGKSQGSVFSGRIYRLAEASAVAALKLQATLPSHPSRADVVAVPPTTVAQSFWDKWMTPIVIAVVGTVVGGVIVWRITR